MIFFLALFSHPAPTNQFLIYGLLFIDLIAFISKSDTSKKLLFSFFAKETLFNWLSHDSNYPKLSYCIDLFAGSGALGFEAASGGAKSVFLIEKSKKIYHSLLSNAELLNAENCRIFHTTAQSFLERYPEQFDIFFLDPPFSNPEILENTVSMIKKRLKAGQLIYLEGSNIKSLKELCQSHSLNIYKESSAGQRAGILAEKRKQTP